MSKDGTPEEIDANQFKKLLVELGPLLVFFLVNAKWGIFVGTGAFMVAVVISLITSRALFGHIATMPLITGAFVLVFGGLTLWFHDDTFIKMKPTIVNTLFATILLAGLAAGRSLLKLLLGEVFKLTDDGWRILTLRWALFFIFLAVLNEVVWRNFSRDAWVAFKVWGIMPLTFVFMFFQVGLLKRHASEPLTREPQ